MILDYILQGFSSEINKIAESSEILVGGKADGKPDSKYNKKQLSDGIKVEMEHTDNPTISKEIAKDHLEEIPDYYTRLLKMENQAKREGKYVG